MSDSEFRSVEPSGQLEQELLQYLEWQQGGTFTRQQVIGALRENVHRLGLVVSVDEKPSRLFSTGEVKITITSMAERIYVPCLIRHGGKVEEYVVHTELKEREGHLYLVPTLSFLNTGLIDYRGSSSYPNHGADFWDSCVLRALGFETKRIDVRPFVFPAEYTLPVGVRPIDESVIVDREEFLQGIYALIDTLEEGTVPFDTDEEYSDEGE